MYASPLNGVSESRHDPPDGGTERILEAVTALGAEPRTVVPVIPV